MKVISQSIKPKKSVAKAQTEKVRSDDELEQTRLQLIVWESEFHEKRMEALNKAITKCLTTLLTKIKNDLVKMGNMFDASKWKRVNEFVSNNALIGLLYKDYDYMPQAFTGVKKRKDLHVSLDFETAKDWFKPKRTKQYSKTLFRDIYAEVLRIARKFAFKLPVATTVRKEYEKCAKIGLLAVYLTATYNHESQTRYVISQGSFMNEELRNFFKDILDTFGIVLPKRKPETDSKHVRRVPKDYSKSTSPFACALLRAFKMKTGISLPTFYKHTKDYCDSLDTFDTKANTVLEKASGSLVSVNSSSQQMVENLRQNQNTILTRVNFFNNEQQQPTTHEMLPPLRIPTHFQFSQQCQFGNVSSSSQKVQTLTKQPVGLPQSNNNNNSKQQSSGNLRIQMPMLPPSQEIQFGAFRRHVQPSTVQYPQTFAFRIPQRRICIRPLSQPLPQIFPQGWMQHLHGFQLPEEESRALYQVLFPRGVRSVSSQSQKTMVTINGTPVLLTLIDF